MSEMLDFLCGKARLQECAKTDPPGYGCSGLTPEDIADLSYHRKKVSGELRVRDDRQAFEADLSWLDAMRRAGL